MLSQIVIVLFGFLISFYISKKKRSAAISIIGFFMGSLIAWIGGSVFVVWVFVNANYTEALVSILSKGFLFALVSAGAGVYYGRKTASEIPR